MPLSFTVDPVVVSARTATECHQCGKAPRYVHKQQAWCRECLDKEQYPQFAHLTQDEREALRKKACEGETKRSIVNTENMSSRMGFSLD